MNLDELKQIADKWNAFTTDEERWRYIVSEEGKKQLGLFLDNDHTGVGFQSEVIPDDMAWDDIPGLKGLDNWIGNSPGLDTLLPILGIWYCAEPV